MADYASIFPEDAQQANKDIAEYFGNTLKRQIRNDIQRELRHKFTSKQLQEISFSENGNVLGLQNIKITSQPVFELRDFDVDLKNFTICAQFGLENVTIDAEYSAFTENFFKLPLSHQGKLSLSLKNTSVICNIGIYNKEDSFVPITYDCNYKINNIEIKLVSYSPTGEMCKEHNFHQLKTHTQTECTSDSNNTIMALIWVEVQAFLNYKIHRLTADNIVEFSFGELFNDEPELIRKYEEVHLRAANKSFDLQLHDFVSEYAKAAELSVGDSISTRIKLENGDYKLHIGVCRLNNLETLKRLAETTMVETSDEISCYAYCALKDFTYVLENFTITSAAQKIQGTIKVQPDSHKILIKFLQPKSSHKRVSVNLVQLSDLSITEKHLSEYDTHTFEYVSEAIMPFIRAHARYHTNQVLQRLVRNLNKYYEKNN